MGDEYNDAYAVGLSRGWDHAAYVDAYGDGVPDSAEWAEAEAERVKLGPGPYADGADGESGYRTGYRDGIDKYRDGGWMDDLMSRE